MDFHFEQPLLQNNLALFVAEWRRFWTDLVSLPTYRDRLSARVFPELANEWDKWGCRWETATASKGAALDSSDCGHGMNVSVRI
jgi:hypothetical protein